MSFALHFEVAAVENDELVEVVGVCASTAAGSEFDAGTPRGLQHAGGTGDEFEAALKALVAGAVVALEAFGSEWATVNISFSGHVNPGNGPRDGWAHEFMSSNIGVRSYRPVSVA